MDVCKRVVMAGTSKVVETVITQGRVPRSRAAKLAKALLKIGAAPGSLRGGGAKGTVDWFDDHIAFYALSIAVAEPITAVGRVVPIFAGAEFVRRSRAKPIQRSDGGITWHELSCETRNPDNALLEFFTQDGGRGVSVHLDKGDVSQVFQIVIRALANGSLSEETLRASDLQFFFSVAGPDAPRVSVHFNLPNGDEITDLYWPNPPVSSEEGGLFDRSCIRRTVQIGPDFLIILADLLRDSIHRADNITLPPGSRRARGGSAPKKVARPDIRPEDEPTDEAQSGAESTNESSDTLAGVSAQSGDRSNDAAQRHTCKGNGAATLPNVPDVCAFVTPALLAGCASSQSKTIGIAHGRPNYDAPARR